MKVLAGYASEHGSTRAIAERIAGRLRERGLYVETLPMAGGTVTGLYDAYVLGSALHNGGWLAAGEQFVQDHGVDLATRPVWLFSVGIPAALTPALRPWVETEEPKQLPSFKAVIRLEEHRLFSGVIRTEHLSPIGRILFRLLGGHYGDFRDLPAIDGWAEGVAQHLLNVQFMATA